MGCCFFFIYFLKIVLSSLLVFRHFDKLCDRILLTYFVYWFINTLQK